ncbi:competence protein CoiA [Aquicoccus porphyridii]|nr:competence protein CoiA family protein [Aquicoccus porphyridii]
MEFALVNGERDIPQLGVVAECPGCGAPVTAKCGEQRVWHWAHKGRKHCDPWHENETEWHRGWKSLFPQECQEVIHVAPDGEKHIADVKTPHGLVIEFQHSHLQPDERRAREAFYDRMIWVVDGSRLKRDRPRLVESFRFWHRVGNSLLFLTPFVGKTLPKNWTGCKVPVMFDFTAGDNFVARTTPGGTNLWCLFPGRVAGYAMIALCGRNALLRDALSGKLNLNHEGLAKGVTTYMARQNAAARMQTRRWSGRRRARF